MPKFLRFLDKSIRIIFGGVLLIGIALTFNYVSEGTYHRLQIPQNDPGEVILRISDDQLEDNLNALFKIPLTFLPRRICLANNNRSYSDGIEISPSQEFPNVGEMNLYIEKDHQPVIKPINARVGEIVCRPINLQDLEGALTTANYVQTAFFAVVKLSDGSVSLIGAHPTSTNNHIAADVKVDVAQTFLWVGLSPLGYIFLVLFSFLGVSAVTIATLELLKKVWNFLTQEQLISKKMDTRLPDSFFRVTIKALVVQDGKILLQQEDNGGWELPGGGMDFGEDPHTALRREIKEETGLEIEWIADRSMYIWPNHYADGSNRNLKEFYSLAIGYPAKFKSFDFTPSNECVAFGWFTKEEMQDLPVLNQLLKFREIFNPEDF